MKMKLPKINTKKIDFTNKVTGEPDSFIKYSIKLGDGYHDLKAKKGINLQGLQEGQEVEVLIKEREYNGTIYKDYEIIRLGGEQPATSPQSTFNMPLEKDFDLINQKLDRIINQNDELKDKYEVLIKVLNDIPNIEVPF